MLKKSIENIVFYKTLTGEKKATVFYKDGFVKNISFEEGIDACEEIVKENNIQTKDAFKEMINRKVVHVVPLSTLTATFDKYFPKDKYGNISINDLRKSFKGNNRRRGY